MEDEGCIYCCEDRCVPTRIVAGCFADGGGEGVDEGLVSVQGGLEVAGCLCD